MTGLSEIAAAVVADADARGVYMTDAMAARVARIETARCYVAFGPTETRAQRLKASNVLLAPYGLRILDSEAM